MLTALSEYRAGIVLQELASNSHKELQETVFQFDSSQIVHPGMHAPHWQQ
jgi:hypothetical protein